MVKDQNGVNRLLKISDIFRSKDCSSSYHVKMHDVFAVHKFDSLANLSHENGTDFLLQYKLVIDHSTEKFTTDCSAK